MSALAAPASPATSTGAWYRSRWPWFLMLGPAIVFVAGFATLYIAFRTDDGLVADDYYKRGLAINQTLDRTARSAALAARATVDVDADGSLRVALESRAALPPVLAVRFLHPTRAGLDQVVQVALGPAGRYAGRLREFPVGRRLVIVETPDWRLGPVETTGESHVVLESQAP